MKAIVLTCDKYHRITDLMLETYQSLWSSNQLTFLIPWNDIFPTYIKEKWGDKVEFIQTPVEFKPTINNLLDAVGNDDEWVYWCTDDSYLVDIDEEAANATYDFAVNAADPSIYSVMFYNGQYDRAHRTFDANDFIKHNDYTFVRKNKITYQWQHQFCRAKVIRRMFDCLDEPEFPKQMDHMQKEEKSQHFWNMITEGKWYILDQNAVIMAEPTSRGMLTQNSVDTFTKYGLELPTDQFDVGEAVIYKQ
tara:strand:+ start:216 stop:962 length:747 start_codon:yes stop_codon:yes gene_type:complete